MEKSGGKANEGVIRMIGDIAEYAIMNLQHRGMRSLLTIVAIVIGVFAIVVMVSIAEGLDAYIKNQLSFLGNDMVSVVGGTLGTGGSLMGAKVPLTENDLNTLKKLPEITMIGATMEGRASMTYRNKTISMYVIGVDPELLQEFYQFDMEEGRLIKEGDRSVVVLGYTIAKDMFDEEITVGRRVLIENRSFNVIGVMGKGTGLTSAMDIVAYIPREDARSVMPGFRGNRDITEIHMKMIEGSDPREVEESVTDELLRLRKVREEEKDFTVITSAYINEQVGNITAALGLFLGGIAAISLLVGSIGIANTMFMSILERTREIGVMKAIGATNRDIMNIFLIESGIIGLIGGVIGLVLSVAVSNVISYFGIPSSVRFEIMVGALLFSLLVGIAAGYFPARGAAKLDAVEALRYE